MRKQDIKIGEHYAYGAHSYARAREVKVVDFNGRYETGYGWNRTRHTGGITVEYMDGGSKGNRIVTTGRNIHRTWAEETEARKAETERFEALAQSRREEAVRRAAKARQIEDFLAGHGVEAQPHMVFGRGDDTRGALDALDWPKQDDPDFRHYYLARFDLNKFMGDGTLGEDVVTTMLADLA